MLVSYPALFYRDAQETVPYFVTFPDFENAATQGENITDALAMATDWLGITAADYRESQHELPTTSAISTLSLAKDNPFPGDLNYDSVTSFISMVLVDLTDY